MENKGGNVENKTENIKEKEEKQEDSSLSTSMAHMRESLRVVLPQIQEIVIVLPNNKRNKAFLKILNKFDHELQVNPSKVRKKLLIPLLLVLE